MGFELPKYAGWTRGCWARAGVVFQIEQEQNEQNNHDDHKKSEPLSAVNTPT
jgi:hypothetical protein